MTPRSLPWRSWCVRCWRDGCRKSRWTQGGEAANGGIGPCVAAGPPAFMKRAIRISLVALAALYSLTGCVTPGPPPGTFASVQPVLERYCVHCHGTTRLKFMPAIGTSAELAKLRGEAKFIVPGKPEVSRFYQVTILADDEPGAMPPSGHAIPRGETDKIRQWILAGAALPAVPVPLVPHGQVPRSR